MGQSEDLEGIVTITASEANSAFLLPQFIKKIRNLAPGETVAATFSKFLLKNNIFTFIVIPKNLYLSKTSNS